MHRVHRAGDSIFVDGVDLASMSNLRVIAVLVELRTTERLELVFRSQLLPIRAGYIIRLAWSWCFGRRA